MVGCAAERDPINRVQANAIPKSFFIGDRFQDTSDDPEFYARSMIVDVPYGESGADWGFFTNSINSLAKIKWSVEETQLVGRISFERIDDTDGKGLPPKKDPERDTTKPLAQNDGVPVYAFRITSQFDIRRAYNSQTGEESNVVEENASDRPWYDREYIRVDFSQNLVTTAYDFDTMSLLGVYGGVKYSPMAFDVRNPNDENAPVYDMDKGYVDVTNKLFAEPQMLNAWGMHFPACLLPNILRGGTEPVGNCNPNEITVRHSFKRVVNTDYEPQDWDGRRFETYGAFFMQRNGYARDYGAVDGKWKRYISRYNIWERSHAYQNMEAMEGATSCKSDNQCANVGSVPGASHCDTYNEKCTLPYKDRTPKPVVWHYADKSAPEYFDVTREAAEEWDAAMRLAVETARYAECQRFTPEEDCAGMYPAVIQGNYADEEDAIFLLKEIQSCRREVRKNKGDIKACDAKANEIGEARKYAPEVIELAKRKEMVILCHSPVTEEDEAFVDEKGNKYCGEKGTVARLGDLRFHLVTSVATPQTNSPWGIMSDSNDPLTGEHIAASVNVWTHVNDLWSRGIIDTFRYIGGELKDADITDGKYVHDWVEAARNTTGAGLSPQLTSEELDKRIAAVARTTPAKMREVETKFNLDPRFQSKRLPESPLRSALINDLKRVAQTRSALGEPSVNAPIYEARRKMLQGSPVEAQLITPAMQQLATAGFGQVALDNDTKTQATSVVQGLFPEARRQLENQLELALAQRGSCVMHNEALAPLGYTAMSDILQEKFGKFNPGDDAATQLERADKMKDYLRRRAHYSVISHEMGHSFGLRHNFVSSSDSWNFRPQYWALRTDAKRLSNAQSACDPVQGGGDGKNCVGPRWLDKVTPNETKNLIHLWSQSSTMEYAGEVSQDTLGLGAYDFGAARMFYGDTASVYRDNKFKASQALGAIAMDHQNTFGGLLGFRYGGFSTSFHYSQLDAQVGLIEGCDTSVNPESFRPAGWDEKRDGKWSPVLDGHIVTNEAGKWTRCKQPKVDYVQWGTLVDTGTGNDFKTHAAAGPKAGYAKDKVRVPHGFASDEWADLGNVTVFRHDNGADLYETMHFWIAQQEMNHIFTNYRRGRRDFSVWGSFQRTLSRYHEKMRDAAKGIGLYVNLARDTVTQYNAGSTDPQAFVAEILKEVAVDNTVASSIAFDQFAHVFARPQPGPHGKLGAESSGIDGVQIARSFEGTGFTQGQLPILSVANGVTGGFGTISLAGRPIENALADNQGRDYDRDYTLNVGSYYEKAFVSYLLTESADNFISSSRDDFVDPRFRSVSLADVFPDGFRRWFSNNLTNDEVVKGVYVRADESSPGTVKPPQLDKDGYALLGTTSWWTNGGIEACFPSEDRIFCNADPFAPVVGAPAAGTVVDPQVGWEQQKFAMVLALIFLPDNQKRYWIDQMRIYDASIDNDPAFDNRIEFHDPTGKIYVAQTFGQEKLFSRDVEKGIGARILQYANELLEQSVDTEPVMRGGRQVGLKPVLTNGQPTFRNGKGGPVVASCDNSRACSKLKNYVSVPEYFIQTQRWLGYIPGGGLKGVY